ncbi:MAG: nucleotidyltransferase family protein [Eubacterium sp.]
MNSEKEYFIYLLSCFLNDEKPCGQAVDWKVIYNLADNHDVAGIIAREIKLLPDDYKPKNEFKSYFNQQLGLTVKNYSVKELAKEKIKAFFDKNEIKHIFVKGEVIKKYYPIPELRTSGDIDVTIQPEDFDKTLEIIKKSNTVILNVVSNTITISLFKVEIEIHKYADVKSDYFDCVFDLCTLRDGYTYEMDKYTHLLYITCHLCKHLAYRGAGIRMLMDMDVLVRAIENFNRDKFIKMCFEAEIGKSAEVLLSLCNLWFKTPVKPYYDIVKDISLITAFEHIMLDGGSFGYNINSIPFSSADSSRIKTLLKLAFPDRDFLKVAYPYYEKHSFLLPVARANRIADGFFKKRKQAKASVKQIMSDSNISAVQRDLLNELEIK